MNWSPLTKFELDRLILSCVSKMSHSEAAFWHQIKVKPKKWHSLPWSKDGNGFWVVGIFGQKIIWYNDIEEGFNISKYTEFGTIDEYFSDQRNLIEIVRLTKSDFVKC